MKKFLHIAGITVVSFVAFAAISTLSVSAQTWITEDAWDNYTPTYNGNTDFVNVSCEGCTSTGNVDNGYSWISNDTWNNFTPTFNGNTDQVTVSCVGCDSYGGTTGGYSWASDDTWNNYTPTYNGNTDFVSTSCVGCDSYFSTPTISNSNYSSVDYGSTNYGSVDYGATNYGSINYGSGGSWTGVITTNHVNTQCPAGTTLINGVCQINSTSCPAGTTLINGTCRINTTSCPAGTTLTNGVCVTNTTSCPAGTTLVNGVCVVNTTSCPAGSTLINGVCQINTTQCPAGSTLINGVCRVNTTSCPAGTTLINGVCQVTTTSCPAGSTLINGICQVNTTSCPAGTTLINGVCQINTTSCPAGSYLQNGICVVQTTSYTCPNGQVVSNLYACPVTYGQTSYSYTTMPIVYQTCWDGSRIPNTSVCPAQYKVCANGTSIPVYQTCYVAPLPVYVPPPVIKFNNVVTSPVTQITNTSARCNGIGLIAQNAQSTGWFEYGQTTNLGRSTAQAIIGSAPTSPFSNVLTNLQPSTTYYCRAVMQNQYGLVKGEIVKFTTKGVVAKYVQPAPAKKTTTTKTTTKKNEIACVDGTFVSVGNQTSASMLNEGQKLIAIQLEKVTGELVAGSNASYRLSYKNLSNTALSGVVIKVTVPEEFTLTNVPSGSYDAATHTITFNQMSVAPYSENVIEWSGAVAKNAPIGKTVVTTAYVLYTVPGTNVQDEVTAYTASSIMQPADTGKLSGAKNVVGTGYSFLPGSLVEWLALIAILFIIFILGRSIAASYKKGGDAHH